MQPRKIQINNQDIKFAEHILFGKTGIISYCKGDSIHVRKHKRERQDFIKNLDTSDLQAVPGSGKTTAMLLKLIILDSKMPFVDGSGILVISHTNVAVDEIKNKIGKHCPRLFIYPNFVGTIQAFVDKFLAIPFYLKQFGKKPYRIDNEIYDEKVEQYFEKSSNICFRTWVENNGGVDALKKIRFDEEKNLISNLNKSYEDFRLKDRTKNTYKAIVKMKEDLMDWGYLHFDDAYYLAECYIAKFPQIKNLLQRRFRFVFIDEMQDMDVHQYNLLEKLFLQKKILGHCYQRIGDRNQSIYGYEVKLDEIWDEKKKDRRTLILRGTHRLSPENASIVQYFGLEFSKIESLKENHTKPHIVVFENPEDVLPKFAQLITHHGLSDDEYPFYAVGWRSEHDIEGNLGIKDYYPDFEKQSIKSKIDHPSLLSYLKAYRNGKSYLEPIRKNILNALLKILRLEGISTENEYPFTKRSLLKLVSEQYPEIYESVKLKLYNWSFALYKDEIGDVYDELKEFIPLFFKEVFDISNLSDATSQFMGSNEVAEVQDNEIVGLEKNNIYEENGVKINVGTVHSIKGQTHTATLYCETFYYNDGGTSYESQRLKAQLNGNMLSPTAGKRVKQSAKVAYVGCSRPTDLLCLAIHKDRFNQLELNLAGWEVIKLWELVN